MVSNKFAQSSLSTCPVGMRWIILIIIRDVLIAEFSDSDSKYSEIKYSILNFMDNSDSYKKII